MGKRGPRPTPDEILAKTGDHRARKRLREAATEGETNGVEPARPDWLAPAAVDLWLRLIPLLRCMGVLAEWDAWTIGRYCQTLAEWIDIDKALRTQDRTYELVGGAQLPNPLFAIRAGRAKELTQFEDRFGLTPSARTSLRIVRSAARKANADGKKQGKVVDASRFFGRQA